MTGASGLKVSVCVPAYERAEMLAELIGSVRLQDYTDLELCIADDSVSDSVERCVAALSPAMDGLVYERNQSRLGYWMNLRRAISLATGDVIVVLGDDDLFTTPGSVSRYAKAFAAHPDAHFAFANLLQVDDRRVATLAYRPFASDAVFPAGPAAVEALCLRSIVITGMAFRRSERLANLYPTDRVSPGADRLYPQVELVGRLLLQHGGMGIADYLCAFRVHPGQFALRRRHGSDDPPRETDSSAELPWIIDRISAEAGEPVDLRRSLTRQFVAHDRTILVDRRIRSGVVATSRHVWALVTTDRVARRSPSLWLAWLVAVLPPARLLLVAKNGLRRAWCAYLLRRDHIDRDVVRDLAIAPHATTTGPPPA
ncbi:MAG TPA: glycosyltransferase family A protein [Acidimicrobiales bacterium]|nr:glycosyltransferase family A protein [Acidimicrobiales bacterium]